MPVTHSGRAPLPQAAVTFASTTSPPCEKWTVSFGNGGGSGYLPTPRMVTLLAAVVMSVYFSLCTTSGPRLLEVSFTSTPFNAVALLRTAIWKVTCSPRVPLRRNASPHEVAGAGSCSKTFSPMSANH